jgi:hypothetical protein
VSPNCFRTSLISLLITKGVLSCVARNVLGNSLEALRLKQFHSFFGPLAQILNLSLIMFLLISRNSQQFSFRKTFSECILFWTPDIETNLHNYVLIENVIRLKHRMGFINEFQKTNTNGYCTFCLLKCIGIRIFAYYIRCTACTFVRLSVCTRIIAGEPLAYVHEILVLGYFMKTLRSHLNFHLDRRVFTSLLLEDLHVFLLTWPFRFLPRACTLASMIFPLAQFLS